jgi:hypothetical protein
LAGISKSRPQRANRFWVAYPAYNKYFVFRIKNPIRNTTLCVYASTINKQTFMDTGHVKQVASFEKLLGFCNAHGAMFNPSKAALQPAALSALLTSAQDSIEAVRTARTAYREEKNVRNDAFDSLPRFMTRIINVLAASGVTQATMENGYTIVKKFRRTGTKKNKVPAEGQATIVTHSVSQLDFDSMLNNFEAMVSLVGAQSSYQPNEQDLTLNALQVRATELRTMNTAVISALVVLSNARASRNKLLFEQAGIHGAALAAKRYVKGAFGTQSLAYNQIKGILFINRKPE